MEGNMRQNSQGLHANASVHTPVLLRKRVTDYQFILSADESKESGMQLFAQTLTPSKHMSENSNDVRLSFIVQHLIHESYNYLNSFALHIACDVAISKGHKNTVFTKKNFCSF